VIIGLWALVLVFSVWARRAFPQLWRWFELAGVIAMAGLVALTAVAGQWGACAVASFLALVAGLCWWSERRS
jgi:hypothetical protein